MKNNDLSSAPGELNWAQLTTLIAASNLLNATLDHNEVLRQLMNLAAQGVDADCATLYLLDEPRQELRSIVLLDEALHEIRLPLEEGLAGHTARSGEASKVADAYADPRFSRRIDEKTGYQTRTVLTVPMRDPQGNISGVVQALNKRQGLFTEEDELYLLALAEQASLALENARLHETMVADCQRLQFLFHINDLATTDAPLGEILFTIVQNTAETLEAEASSILLWDWQHRQLAFRTVASEKEQKLREVQVPLDTSIAGWVFQNEQAVAVNDVQNDPRFFAGADEHTGFVTRNLVCAPMKMRGRVIGVLEVLNKRSEKQFSEADLQLTQAVANQIALAIESARQYEDSTRE